MGVLLKDFKLPEGGLLEEGVLFLTPSVGMVLTVQFVERNKILIFGLSNSK